MQQLSALPASCVNFMGGLSIGRHHVNDFVFPTITTPMRFRRSWLSNVDRIALRQDDLLIQFQAVLQALVGELKVQDVQYSPTTRKLLVRLDDSLTM